MKIICLTPIKNEAWILDRFLKCASLWADHIIIADQGSTDNSREIALCYPKVTLVENPSSSFNEPERQKILLDAARKIPGFHLLISLDADECLTSNFRSSTEWQTVLNAVSGTIICFHRVNLLPNMKSYWLEGKDGLNFPFGFVDDGSKYVGDKIHSKRVPTPVNAPMIYLRDIKVLHYQFTHWERMQSKHRWYQCWERINRSSRKSIEIYRQYHHMDALQNQVQPLPESWLSEYVAEGIDMTSIRRESIFWWDREILDWLSKYGTKTFKHEAIWDVDWSKLASAVGSCSETSYADPRNRFDKFIHRWLKKSQPRTTQLSVRFIERVLSLLGW